MNLLQRAVDLLLSACVRSVTVTIVGKWKGGLLLFDVGYIKGDRDDLEIRVLSFWVLLSFFLPSEILDRSKTSEGLDVRLICLNLLLGWVLVHSRIQRFEMIYL